MESFKSVNTVQMIIKQGSNHSTWLKSVERSKRSGHHWDLPAVAISQCSLYKKMEVCRPKHFIFMYLSS